MVHFVLNDINPDKVNQIKPFFKAINDVVFMLTLGKAPAIFANKVVPNADQSVNFEWVENKFKASFKGHFNGDSLQSGLFELNEDGKRSVEISFSIHDQQPIDMRVQLNTEGELLAKKELERTFKRDFSSASLKLINEDYVQQKEVIEQPPKINQITPNEPAFAPSYETGAENPETDDIVDDQGEIAENIDQLSDRINHSIAEVNEMIALMNNLCYDFTRGASPNIVDIPLKEEKLENGARIELIDAEENGYVVTFRKGSLDDVAEVSFFLEKEGELIFSVYFSSLGNGKIVAGGDKAPLVIKRLKSELI